MTIKIEVVLCEERFHLTIGKVKFSFNDTAISPCLDHPGFCTLSQQQGNSSKEDTFTGTSLTRNNRETALETDVELGDEGVVLYG